MQSIRKQELKNLLEIVKKHPEGISIQQVLEELNFCVAKRTLQYRLSILVKSGFIKLEGLGRSSRYLFNFELEKEQSPQPGKEEEKPSGIPLSSEGHKVRQIIIKPLHLRHHVSYQRNFLDSYHPNKSYYLSKPVLDKLAQLSVKEESKLPAGTLAKKMYQKLLVDLSWNSSRLEGNTYSLQDTEKLLATGEIAQGKDPIETQMILNHKAAIEFVIDMAEEINISRYTILNIHGLLSQNLLTDPTDCGKLRTIPVKIGKSVYHPTEVPQLIEECFEIIIHKAAAIDNPFEQSFFLMVHLPYLQPFVDINKRVSRLAANIPFIRENLCPLSFVDVPESDYIEGLLGVYELNRPQLLCDVFVFAYERSSSLYMAAAQATIEIEPIRTRYRNQIQQAILTTVLSKKNKKESSQLIAKFAKEHIPVADQNRFIEIVEIELACLHEGNFARFKIRLKDFFTWKDCWK